MKQHRNTFFLILSLMLLSLAWACGGGETTTNNPSPAESPKPTTEASPKPEASPANTASTGEPSKEDIAKIYETRCAACHSADGKGKKAINDKMPDFTDAKWQEAEKDDALLKSIADGKGEGKGAMPKWSGLLKPEEIKGLVAHVRTFKK